MFRVKTIQILIFFIFSYFSGISQENYLLVKGEAKANGDLTSVMIFSFLNDLTKKDSTFTESGKFLVLLDYNKSYTISISKQDFITKSYVFNTYLPDQNLTKLPSYFYLDVNLMPAQLNAGKDSSLNIPDTIVYDSNSGSFNYTDSIQKTVVSQTTNETTSEENIIPTYKILSVDKTAENKQSATSGNNTAKISKESETITPLIKESGRGEVKCEGTITKNGKLVPAGTISVFQGNKLLLMSYTNSAGKYALYLKPDEDYKMKITTEDSSEVITDFSTKNIKPGIPFIRNIELQEYLTTKEDLLANKQDTIVQKQNLYQQVVVDTKDMSAITTRSGQKPDSISPLIKARSYPDLSGGWADVIPAKYYNKAIFRKGIIYMVQIAETEKPLPYGYFDNIEQKFLTLSISYFKDVDGTYKYCISFFSYLEDAQKVQNLLSKNGFSATIVVYKDGKKIPTEVVK